MKLVKVVHEYSSFLEALPSQSSMLQHIRNGEFTFRIKEGAEEIVYNAVGFSVDEFSKKAASNIRRIHEMYIDIETGDVFSFVASYDPCPDYEERYNCNRVYIQFNRDSDKYEPTYETSYCTYEREKVADRFKVDDNRDLSNAYAQAKYPFAGFSGFDYGDKNGIALNIGETYIPDSIKEQMVNEILLETSQTYLDKDNIKILSVYYEGDTDFQDLSVGEIYYSIAKKKYVYNLERKEAIEYKPLEPLDEEFEECPAVKTLVKKANAKYAKRYVDEQIDVRFNSDFYTKQFRETFTKHFPKVPLSKDFKPDFPGYESGEVIFKINDYSISIRVDSDTDEMENIPFSSIDDRFESVVKRIEAFTKQLSKFSKTWLNNANALLKEKSLRKFSDDFKTLYLNYEMMPTSQRIIPEISSTMTKLRTRLNEYNKLDLKKLNNILSQIRDYLNPKEERSEQENFNFRERIYELKAELNEQEAHEVSVEWNLFTDHVVKEDFKDESISNFRRVFIHKNAKKEYESLSSDAKKAVIEIVKNMKTLDGQALLRYFVSSLQMNAPYHHINYKIRIKNIAANRLWFWYGKDFTDRRECAGDIYIHKITTTPSEHDDEIKKSKNEKPYKYKENDFEIFVPEQSDRNFYLPELTSDQYKVSAQSEGPCVTYGCAGSGKTLDSIDQYWLIYKKLEEKGDEDKESIAYVTFQRALKDKAIEQIKAYEVPCRCYTLPEFFKSVAKSKIEKDASDEKTFVTWFENYYSSKNAKVGKRRSDVKYIKDMPDVARLVYTYYRGIYKGSTILYEYVWSTGKGRHVLTEDEFKNRLGHEANNDATGVHYLSKDQIQNIYDVCHAYYEQYCKGSKYDDNDWAIDALVELKRKNARRVKTIIIDEVQDLTSLQLRVLLRSLKNESTNIFFYGDPHQTINPTIFDDGVLSTAVRDVLGCDLKDGVQLTDMHRTNVGLRKYLAALQDKRTMWLGSYMDNVAKVIDNSKEAKNEEKRWATKLFDESLEYAILKQAQDSASMTIVPSQATKEYLANKYPSLSEQYMFTIYEAKGIEWKRVVLYNMLSDAKYYFEQMIEGKGKRSTICRTFFNKYYVACTRARDTFIVIENDLPDTVKDEMLSELPEIKTLDQVKYYFDGNATYKEWIDEARKLMSNEAFESATHALQQASMLASSAEEIAYVDELTKTLSSKTKSAEDNLKLAEIARKKEQWVIAQIYYKAAKKYDYYNLCLIHTGKQIEKPEYLQSLIKSGLLDDDFEAFKRIGEQKVLYELLDKTYKRLTSKKGNK